MSVALEIKAPADVWQGGADAEVNGDPFFSQDHPFPCSIEGLVYTVLTTSSNLSEDEVSYVELEQAIISD
jgi:hypothetical protein